MNKIPIFCLSRVKLTVIVILTLVFLFPSLAITKEIIHVTKTNLYQWVFKEPIEKLLVFCKDGDLLSFTNEYSEAVVLKPWTLKEYLKKNNKEIKDILFISHNHILPNNFSEGDYQFYFWLKNNGFEGKFILYYNCDGRIREMER